MKTRTKVVLTSIIALILSAVLVFTVIAVSNNKGKISVAETRSVVLEESSIDDQSILEEFDDATLTTVGTTTYFEGYKTLDVSTVSELDYISEVDYETLSESTVKYSFSYDYETNIVTIAATITLPDGSIEIDEISGVGFINDDGEIDAAMNIDGEGVLLSEMRDAGMIENCGWFSSLIKVIAVAAVVVAAVATVVATAGTAAPAVVAAGVAVATTVSTTAATIATYATITAVLAAGIVMTTEVWERYYPGANIVVKNGKSYAKTYEDAKDIIIDITTARKQGNEEDPAIYFPCEQSTNKPIQIQVDNPLTMSAMAELMESTGKNCITMEKDDAYNVMRLAVPAVYPLFVDEPTSGFLHWHANDVFDVDYKATRVPQKNPRYRVNGSVLHSFWCAV